MGSARPTGLISSIGLVILSPAVWVSVLGHSAAIHPFDGPTIFAMPAAFIVACLVSRLDASARARAELDAFADQYGRAQTGYGAAATTH